MAVTEDVARLRLETVGAESLDQVRAKMDALGIEMADLSAAMARGEISVEQFDAASAELATNHTRLATVVTDLGGKLDQGSSKVAGFGQSALQAGRVVQDFTQGGIGGILNNIEGLSMALGGGAGLAGILTIVGTGFFILKPKIEEFLASLKSETVDVFADRMKVLKDQIKELEDKPAKVGIDIIQLEAAKREVEDIKKALEAVERLGNLRSKYEKESGAVIEETFAESEQGAPAIRDRLRQQLAREQVANLPEQQRLKEIQDQIKETRAFAEQNAGTLAGAEAGDTLKTLEAELAAQERKASDAITRVTMAGGDADKALGKIYDAATQGGGAEQAAGQRQLGGLLQRAGLGGVIDIAGASPKALERYDKEAEQFQGQIDARKEAIAVRDEIARTRAKAEEDRARAEKKKADEEKTERNKTEADIERYTAEDQRESARRLAKRQAGAKKGTEAEAKRIEDTVGKQRQLQYEGLMAENQARIATGAPGAVDPHRLAQRLQAQMVGEFRQRGAAPESAALAAKNIAGAGQQDLTRRQSLLAGRTQDTQSQTLMLTRDLMMEYQKLDGTQRSLHLEVQAQRREMQAQRARSKSQLRRVGR